MRIAAVAFAIVMVLVTAGVIVIGTRMDAESLQEWRVADLPINAAVEREFAGATVYVIRREDDSVSTFWGLSPVPNREGRVQCFLMVRKPGVPGPLFVDPCLSIGWDDQGRVVDAGPEVPPVVQIPTEVRDGHVYLDEAFVRCIQQRDAPCSR